MPATATIDAAPQHMRALEVANRVRLARAALKRRVAAGDVEVADVIRALPWEAESMTVSDLLLAQRRWGRTRCRSFLLSLGLPENKPVGAMTQRQRDTLVHALEAKGRGEELPSLFPVRDGLMRPALRRQSAA